MNISARPDPTDLTRWKLINLSFFYPGRPLEFLVPCFRGFEEVTMHQVQL